MRIGAALAAAVVLHAVVLLRPGLGAASQPAASATSVVTVRTLQTLYAAEPQPALPMPEITSIALAAAPTLETAQAIRIPALPSATPRAAVPDLEGLAKPSPKPVPLLPDAPAYLFGARLDPGPVPLDDIQPEYPESAQLQEGTVVLRLLINETGAVDNVAVVRAQPSGLFEPAALDAFAKARFSPGFVLGTAVKSQITIEVHFVPLNRGARISGRTY